MSVIDLVERLTRKVQKLPAMGGGSIGLDANGKTTVTSYITDDGRTRGTQRHPRISAMRSVCGEGLRSPASDPLFMGWAFRSSSRAGTGRHAC